MQWTFDKDAKQFNGKKIAFKKMTLEQLDIHRQKINLGLNLPPYTTINSKWTIGLNVKCKTRKL